MKSTSTISNLPIQDFEEVYSIIQIHRKRAAATVDNEGLMMLWEVGGYVSRKLKSSAWGEGVVTQLSEFIRTQDPTTRGWSYRTIYKMVQLYDTYSRPEFADLTYRMHVEGFARPQIMPAKAAEIVPIEMAQIAGSEIVPIELAQIPNVLFATGWSNHQIIMSRCRRDEERLFYMIYANRERLEYKELERVIKTDTMSTLLGSKDMHSDALKQIYPDSEVLFKDTAYVDYIGLPKKYREPKLRKGIVQHMKEFILEMGKDFLFVQDECPICVGGETFHLDLLFYHRVLHCYVGIELKSGKFHPKDIGQLEFYLEALDRDKRREGEGPSIGILLCRDANQMVVEYALSRSMSPVMVAQYKQALIPLEVLQKAFDEYLEMNAPKILSME